jgi:protein TonB
VTARPRYKRNPEPPYPLAARRRRQEGTVLLSVHVTAAGAPRAVTVARSSGFRALDDAAASAVGRWEFEPGRRDGEPIASDVEIPVRFRLR